jgi:hypothetical protein
MWIPIQNIYKVWTLLQEGWKGMWKNLYLILTCHHKTVTESSCAIMHLHIVYITDVYRHRLLYPFPPPLPLPMFRWLPAFHGYLTLQSEPKLELCFNYVSVCCFEITVWTRDNCDIRVFTWCCAQTVIFYFIIIDHNAMKVFCIFYCLSSTNISVCLYVKQGLNRDNGKLLILPMMFLQSLFIINCYLILWLSSDVIRKLSPTSHFCSSLISWFTYLWGSLILRVGEAQSD